MNLADTDLLQVVGFAVLMISAFVIFSLRNDNAAGAVAILLFVICVGSILRRPFFSHGTINESDLVGLLMRGGIAVTFGLLIQIFIKPYLRRV
jgi:hypothetical protein